MVRLPPRTEEEKLTQLRSMSCAIRECYAAALTVLIMVDDGANPMHRRGGQES